MNEQTFWGWGVRGMGGALAILTMLHSGQGTISEHFLMELKKTRDELNELIVQQESKPR